MTQHRATWREPILEHFSAASAHAGRLTVVIDPDELLTEPGIVELLAERGYELLPSGDPVAFRYAYETRFRQPWDHGRTTHLVVVVRAPHGDASAVPHDLLAEARANGRVLSFSLAQLFPSLAPSVLDEVDPLHFDVVAQALAHADPGDLGINATQDFVLRHVFGIAPELIQEPADLLRALLRRHYGMQEVPSSLDARFIDILVQSPTWRSWPLERIVPSREAFFAFLEERWPRFLLAQGLKSVPGREPIGLRISGPVDLPFDHDDIRVYMDNLFAEGILDPTVVVQPPVDGRWYAIGIAGSVASSAAARYRHVVNELRDSIPNSIEATNLDWQDFALRWGTWTRLRWQTIGQRDDESEADANALTVDVQSAFSSWLSRRFGPMASLPYLPRPVLGHHVPHFLAHELARDTSQRVALLVVDGMAIDQWRILQASFEDHDIEEHAVFSWIPTLTQVSRQALFSGRVPLEFATSIEGTQRESVHWSNFWQDRGLSARAVTYVSPQGKKDSFGPLAQEILVAADDPTVRVIGSVIGVIDQSMHQVGLGTAGLHSLVEVWAKSKQLVHLVDALLDRGFSVFVTADHGNTFGRGVGKPNVGSTAEQRGERAHIFRKRILRDQIAQLFPTAIEWPQVGLPPDYYPLLAPYGGCFLAAGKESVSHGGIALEEVLVPFVRIREAR